MSNHSHSWSALALIPASLLAGTPNTNPSSAESDFNALYSSAEKALQNNKPAEALKIFSDLEKKSAQTPAKVRALFLLQKANCYYQQKDWKSAASTLKDFLEKFPKGTEDLLGANDNRITTCQFMLAEVYRQLSLWESALEALDHLAANLLLPPKDRSTACRLAASFLQEKTLHASTAEKSNAQRQAIELLKKAVSVGLNTPEGKLAGSALIEAYILQHQLPEAQALQAELESCQPTAPAEIIRINQLRQTQGDAAFAEARTTADATAKVALLQTALRAYQATLPKLSILTRIQKKSAELKISIAELTRLSAKPSPAISDKLIALQAELQECASAETTVHQSPNYDEGIYFRLGLCLHELQMPYEAITAFQEVLNTHPLSPHAPSAAFLIIENLVVLGKTRQAQAACRSFIEHYPSANEIPQVVIQLGTFALDQQDYCETLTQYQWVKTKIKKLPVTILEEIDYRCCFATFSLTDWKKADDELTNFVKKYPRSAALEQATYLQALCQFYQGLTEKAQQAFIAYQSRFPTGNFLYDVQYRLALIDYGKVPPQLENARLICQTWLRNYSNRNQLEIKSKKADVYALIGDCESGLAGEIDSRLTRLQSGSSTASEITLSQLEKEKVEHVQRATEAYLNAVKNGQCNADALTYSLSKLNPALKSQRNYETLRDLYLELYRGNKKSPQSSSYLFEAITATEHLPTNSQEAAFPLLTQAIQENIDDPKQDGTESLLTFLANKVYLKYRNSTDGSAQAHSEIDASLKIASRKDRTVALARLYFIHAQLSALYQQPDQVNHYYKLIAEDFPPTELSATLLALTGENCLARGSIARAETFFDFLIQSHRTSEYADYGFAGLATLRLEKKNFAAALVLCAEALKYNFVKHKECSLRLTRGQALAELRQFTEAKKEFEYIAQTKAWRGEGTARSLYWLGLIEERQNHTAEAVAYYRRCYQGWKRHAEWSAKAYWGTARLLAQQLHQPAEASMVIQEMLSHDFIKKTPEAQSAQNLLSAL